MNNLNRQIQFLDKFGIHNYSIIDGRVVINQDVYIENCMTVDSELLQNCIINGDVGVWAEYLDKDFLSGSEVNGSLDLRKLESTESDFLKNTILNGRIDMESLKEVPNGFLAHLKGKSIKGTLDLRSAEYVPIDFLDGVTIENSLYLDSITEGNSELLKNSIIEGCANFRGITKVDADFLSHTIINGSINFSFLESAPTDFLKGKIINGGLNLSHLKYADENFLNGTVVRTSLHLDRLENPHPNFLKNTKAGDWYWNTQWDWDTKGRMSDNISILVDGYNEKYGYCLYDGILRKVDKLSIKNGYTIYTTPSDFVIRKDDFTSHAKTVRQGIQDIEFKIAQEKVRNQPISKETLIGVEMYRLITGACVQGCKEFMNTHGIEYVEENGSLKERKEITAVQLLNMLEKEKSFGYEKLKSLLV